MNPYYYYHHTIPQQQYYAYGVPISLVPAPWVVYDQAIPIHHTTGVFYPRYVQYLAVSQNQFEDFLEESLIMQELEADHALRRAGMSGSGLSEEEISNNLHVYKIKEKTSEVDTCSICLGEYEKREKMGRLECGHRYHAGCIKRWLLSKNVCPMCRSTALTV